MSLNAAYEVLFNGNFLNCINIRLNLHSFYLTKVRLLLFVHAYVLTGRDLCRSRKADLNVFTRDLSLAALFWGL